jgi:6-pyruvoyltetrahydropterin/6-carboxytetrahydropterin synthase
MGKLQLTSVVEIDSAHYLKEYEGKCANLHGHRWKIEVVLEGTPEDLDKAGMLCDFGIIKDILKEYDHAVFVKREDEEQFKRLNLGILDRMVLVDFNPTAENLTIFWAEEIMYGLSVRKLTARLKKITVWETPNNKVTYLID